MRRRGARSCKKFLHQAVKDKEGRAVFSRRNLDILPANPAAPAGLQSFQHRFFGREASGIMLRGHRAAAVAVRAFSDSENPFSETRRAREHFANASNFDNVYADGNDHGR